MTTDGVKPMVLVSAAMYKLLIDNMHKLHALNENSGKTSAETMAGAGNDLPDLPQTPPGVLKLDTAAPPSSTPIVSMLPGGSNGESASTSSNISEKKEESVSPPPQKRSKTHITRWPGKPWHYIASHPTDSESESE